MKTKTLILAVVGLLILLASSVAIAQSLGDLARQERAKRAKETKKAVKVVTDEDLPPRPVEEPKATTSPSESAEQPGEQPAEQPTEQATEPAATPPEEASAPPTEEAKPEDKQKTRDYWQGPFKAARQRIADAEELQRLAEDELSLLQIQQARELSPDAKSDLDAQVKAKNAEVEGKRAQTAKAQKALEDLEEDFKESGAPEDWSKTD
jgi:hypothetical protein